MTQRTVAPPTLVLGIDPGTRFCGWGLVEVQGARVTHVAHDVIHAGEGDPLVDRLLLIDDTLEQVVTLYKPAAAAVETLFFAKDPSAAAKLGHARGVILLRLRRANIPFAEYAPAHIKRAIVGRGLADKSQVAQMMTVLLRLSSTPPPDAADALAVAVTHARTLGLRRAMGTTSVIEQAIAAEQARLRARAARRP
jgi:crossover junction endodeoxyribonuclease RuvC